MSEIFNTANFWELPELTHINKLPAKFPGIPYHDANRAMEGRPEASEFFVSLDGKWQFSLVNSPGEAEDFYKKDFNDSEWASMDVPSNWTLGDFWDKPQYTNVQMPFDNNPPFVPKKNPTGLYRRKFRLPEKWSKRRVILHFGGVESYLEVFLNGQFVGMSKDTRLPSEFDISDMICPGDNQIALRVLRWSDGCYVEDQDHWWMAGVYRSVYLFSLADPVCIHDVHVDGDYDLDTGDGELSLQIKLFQNINEYFKFPACNEPFTIKAKLFDQDKQLVDIFYDKISRYFRCDLFTSSINATITKPAPWSAETPNLYTLIVFLEDHLGNVLDIRRVRVGFRRIEFKYRQMLINGQPVVIHGVNRHEHDERHGKTLSKELMIKDIKLLKQLNLNAVRTAHYPNDSLWYELCDEYGIYLFDEANLESHANYGTLCHDPRWRNAFVERCVNMVLRDRNHPCVIAWSLGNETGFGENSIAATEAILFLDSTRAIHNENEAHADGVDPDILRKAFRDVRDISSSISSIQRPDAELKKDYEKSIFRYNNFADPMYPGIAFMNLWADEIEDERPFIMCEYSHSQGNANGNLKEYFDFLEAGKGFQGGFIWDWVDQGFKRKDPDGEEYWIYGGDFGEEIHDSECCINGIVWPDRTPHPAAFEFKKLAQPVAVELVDQQKGVVAVRNKQFFRNMDWLGGNWKITVDGVNCFCGQMSELSARPGETQEVQLLNYKLPEIYEGQEVHLNLSFKTKNHEAWCDLGYEIASEQILLSCLPGGPCPTVYHVKNKVDITETAEKIIILCGDNLCTFDRKSGQMQFVHDYKPLILTGPQLNVWRACTSTEGIRGFKNQETKPMGLWLAAGYDRIKLVSAEVSVFRKAENVLVKVARKWVGSDEARLMQHVEEYSFFPTGQILVENTFDYDKSLPHLPRVGVIFSITAGFEQLKWYGRGPFENYVDRNCAADVGLYKSTVAEQYVPYIVPQEHGNKTDVRWFELSNSKNTLRFESVSGFEFSASHFYPSDLFECRHTTDLKAREEVIVTIDRIQKGLGTRLFEHDPLTKYLVFPREYKLAYKISVK